jgi:hypothetical protein
MTTAMSGSGGPRLGPQAGAAVGRWAACRAAHLPSWGIASSS